MSTETEQNKSTTVQKPQVFLSNITFNDKIRLELNQNSIIVFTGANNSGKSQVLKDVEHCFDADDQKSPIVVNTFESNYCGGIDEPNFLKERFSLDKQGNYKALELGNAFSCNTLTSFWDAKKLHHGLYKMFVKRLSTESRLISSNTLTRSQEAERSPIYKLYNSRTLEKKISEYFHQAFNVDLIINRRDMTSVPLHVGEAPETKEFTMDKEDDYYKLIKEFPKLQEQGDGMRSFASILLDTFTSEYSVTLIDEPEAFLHPPQAKLLGRMLAQNNPENRQLMIATHSEDFLQGLVEADNKNVTVIRIDRVDNINKMYVLENDEIKKLWGNPLLRYSNILSGLFHEKVVVCESDYDCLFYQAVMDAIYENEGKTPPSILFTHCGGKSRVRYVVSALKAVNVPVVSICDFDLLNLKQEFKPMVEAFGLDWESKLEVYMKKIYARMNSKKESWVQIKKIGKAGFEGDAPAAYEEVEKLCKSVGLFVIPIGEMESFDKTINKEKKEWVYKVLERPELAVDQKLESARKFVQEAVGWKPIS